jgi:carbon-monoxide dehydrogenase medium subunit
MRRFELFEPKTIEEACKMLSDHEDVKVIAGGTALLILIKQGVLLPKTLINLKKIQGAADVAFDAKSGLRVGGLATIYDLETALAVRQHYPLLAQACHVVANIRIRNMATIGGNLAHADYQSDPPAALVALNASVELQGCGGIRKVKLADFLLGMYETSLGRDELLTAVELPLPSASIKGTYVKFTTRSSEDRPCAGVAAFIRGSTERCEELRVVVGAVSPKPVEIDTEPLVYGKKLDPVLIDQVARKAGDAVEPIDDLRGTADYKRQLVKVIVTRALQKCLS